MMPMIGVCKGGLFTVELFRLWVPLVFRFIASFPIVILLHYFLLQFMLYTRLFLSCQINLDSYESELLLGISIRIWFWVVSLFSLRPNLLVAFSRVIDYQPALMALTLMPMSHARKGYLNGTPDKLYFLLVILTQFTAQFYSCLNLLTGQPLIFRVRMSSFSFLLHVIIDVCPC
jgi:hypothetical protein